MAENLSTLSSDGNAGTPTGSGARYVLMSTWEAAAQGFHGVGDQTILECYQGTTTEGNWQADGSLSETGISVSGWSNITATDYITIKAAAGEGHGGVIDGGFRIKASPSNSLSLFANAVQYTRLEDFQAIVTSATHQTVVLGLSGADMRISRLIVKTDTTSSGTCFNLFSGMVIENSLMIASGTGHTVTSQAFATPTTSNCTIINTLSGSAYYGHGNAGFDPVITNTAAYSAGGLAFDRELGPASDYNAGSDTTAPGANSVDNIVLTDGVDFVSPSTGNYNPQPGGKLDGAGADLSGTFTDDIAGNTRSVPWEIGAYEIAAAALTFSLSPDSGPLPAGLSVNATTGNIEGTPTESGTFPNIIIRGSE